MCGIVGLFLKNEKLEPELGEMLSTMLGTMCDRGPDSAGFAIYGTPSSGKVKITVQSADPVKEFSDLAGALHKELGIAADVHVKSSHAVLSIPADKVDIVRSWLREKHQALRVMGVGEAIEIYKEVGYPTDVAKRFDLKLMTGSHAIGHTRMATESAVTTMGAHPFSTGTDQCLVHNGSLSNHNSIRRDLIRDGMRFETENDTEVAAAYLTWRMNQGLNLGDALHRTLDDLDGFFNFLVGTKNGFGVVRDPIACKPAVMAETDDYVAFGSEYRALVNLPKIDQARVWEPEPATVYFWER
jgi:methylamine---glutamate N-methyltransferase subunit A